MRRTSLTHEFVDVIPSEPEDGVLYISVRYRTAVHRCACGCGEKVVTPIRPARWHLTFDGDTVSLNPSVGSWQLACQSHYFITNNHVRWARRWMPEEIAAGRESDAEDVRRYYAGRAGVAAAQREPAQTGRHGWFTRAWHRLRRRQPSD
jgi:hypothetical protein